MNVTVHNGNNPNVAKYVFEADDYIAESVLYKYGTYEQRTVICCSTQSGCPVGCTFCGTGKNFVKNLTTKEITDQIEHVINDIGVDTFQIEKFQIMFMSMGEPLLNWENVKYAIAHLGALYPNAQLLLSTIAPTNDPALLADVIKLSQQFEQVGLQFSIHESTDERRSNLIPYKNKMTLLELRNFAINWFFATGRKPYLNYCVTKDNSTDEDFTNLVTLFPPHIFAITFSVVCSKEEGSDIGAFRDLDYIGSFEQRFIEAGYDTRIFDPAGQDDIGGGCGQLWYVQKWMKEYKERKI